MGINSSKDVSILPKGINKIIEEYCFYELPFKSELFRNTYLILSDTERWWSYDRYYADRIEVRKNRKPFKIVKNKGEWEVLSYI